MLEESVKSNRDSAATRIVEMMVLLSDDIVAEGNLPGGFYFKG